MNLQSSVAIVTGASSGIGKATATALAAQGAHLVLTGRKESELSALAGSLPSAAFLAGDINAPEFPQALIDFAISKFGRFDILVNNAGLMISAGIDDIDLEKMTLMLRTDVEALFRFSYVALRHLKKQNHGYVVNISSIAAYKTAAGIAAYNGAKAAVEAFTDALRLELASTKVGIACIAPGTVATNLYTGWDEKAKDFIFSGGALQAEDIARAIVTVLTQPEHVRIARMLVVPAAQPV